MFRFLERLPSGLGRRRGPKGPSVFLEAWNDQGLVAGPRGVFYGAKARVRVGVKCGEGLLRGPWGLPSGKGFTRQGKGVAQNSSSHPGPTEALCGGHKGGTGGLLGSQE